MLFTKLPVEIRHRTYHLAMTIRGRETPQESYHIDTHRGSLVRRVFDRDGKYYGNYVSTLSTPKVNDVNKLLVCRYFYAEIVPIFYRYSKLSFAQVEPLQLVVGAFVKHQQFTIGALQSLQSMQLEFEDTDWNFSRAAHRLYIDQTIASLLILAQRANSLQKLSVRFDNIWGRETTVLMDRNMLKALGQFRSLDSFDLDFAPPNI